MKKSILMWRKIFLALPALILAGCAPKVATVRAPQEGNFSIGRVRTLHSDILGQDRVLNIYLPNGYKDSDTTHYQVFYLLDGSADEDFIHVAGLVQYNSLAWIDRLPPTIVVGIANVDRKHDFTYPTTGDAYRKILPTGGGSGHFIDFLSKELRPWVDRSYRTSNNRVLIGQSLGGLLATEILLKRPELFNKYIIISPSMWWDDGSLFRYAPRGLNSQYPNHTDIYVAVGKEGPGLGPAPHIMEDDARFLTDTIRNLHNPNLNVTYDYLPAENHATITHSAVFNAIRVLFPPRASQ
jgi:uncharacterized protein